jgi:hypothetical protein
MRNYGYYSYLISYNLVITGTFSGPEKFTGLDRDL